MIVDLTVGILLLLFLRTGFRSGFIPSLLALVGYVIGGFLGLLVAKEFTTDWTGLWSVVGMHILLIFIGAKVGQTILRSLGKGVRGFVGPLKIVDSLLGAVFSLGQGVLLVFIGLQIFSVFGNEAIEGELQESSIVEYLDQYTPEIVNQAFSKWRDLTD